MNNIQQLVLRDYILTFEMIIVLVGVISPTFLLAKVLKAKFNKQKTIRVLNWGYFLIASISLFVLSAEHLVSQSPDNLTRPFLYILWSVFLLSRCTEILYAFLIDAYDKVAKAKANDGEVFSRYIEWYKLELNSSKIEIHHRLVLAFRSYIELIINFSILYSLIPILYWNKDSFPVGIIDSLYFSGVTITTLGYGDISPLHWYPQFLSVIEVFCGFTLIVVCFAIYLSRKAG